MPRRSSSRAWASTQSSTVTTGKSAPQGWPLAGLICIGPLEPKHEPGLLTPMTKKRVVSSGLPGPTRLSHQPALAAGVEAGDVVAGIERMAHQHRVAALRR